MAALERGDNKAIASTYAKMKEAKKNMEEEK
jgi:hypothetical protein